MSVWEKVYLSLKNQIESGDYKPGDKLPSIRQMAEISGSNKITVKKAFDRLKTDGLIENAVGKGSFVRFPELVAPAAGRYDFTNASLSETLFPAETARDLMDRILSERGTATWSSTPFRGSDELISVLSSRYEVPAERTIIISGAQQGLNLAARLFGPNPSETIGFEDPTYPGAISLFRPMMFVPMTPEGPDVESLKQLPLAKMSAFYTISGIHNPTGYLCTDQRKREIAALAEEANFFIIEDDSLSEFRPEKALRYVDLIPHRTIYIKSLSKVSAPGIRLGMLTAPEQLYDKLLYHKYTSDLGSSALTQRFLASFMDSSAWDKHLDKCIAMMNERRTLLLQMLEGYPFLTPAEPSSGFGLWIENTGAPQPENPPWSRGKRFSFTHEFHSWFRITFMGLSESDFPGALEELKKIWDQMDPRF